MRLFRRLIFICAALILTSALLPGTALAAGDEALEKARRLKTLGLFYGVSDTEFDLDRPATRTEAVVMLLRLLGAEDEALSGDFTHPFTDVADWADGYLGYAYRHGLVNGVGGGLFDADAAVSAQHYCALLLRALGFGDRPYEESLTAAAEIGFLTEDADTETFLRSDMVLMSYAVLSAVTADGAPLWEKLADAGVFTREEWLAVISKYGAWDAGFDFAFEEFLGKYSLDPYCFSMAYYNTVTGETILYNEDAWLTAASTYKLPLNMYLTDCFAEGVYAPEDYLPGYGFTLAETQYQSIVFSNNPLSEALQKMVGGGSYINYRMLMTRYFDAEGLDSNNTFLYTNRITAACMLSTLKHLYADPEKYGTILDYMSIACPDYYFKAGVTECPVAHKYGAIDQVSNDVGIFYTDEPFLLVVLSEYRIFSPSYTAAFMYEYMGQNN